LQTGAAANRIALLSVEENKDVVARYFQAIWNEGRYDAEDQFVDPDVVVHAPPIPGIPEGIAGPLMIVKTFRGALPDLQLTNDDLFGEGDVVIQRWTARGSHTGDVLFGAPPSGAQLTMTGINEFRLEGGRIVERWGVMDAAGLMQQLGLVPG
jgi:predicted ester cyclase